MHYSTVEVRGEAGRMTTHLATRTCLHAYLQCAFYIGYLIGQVNYQLPCSKGAVTLCSNGHFSNPTLFLLFFTGNTTYVN